MIQSRFKLRTVTMINVCVVLIVLLAWALVSISCESTSESVIPVLIFFLLVSFFLVWLVWGEMRTKILKIIIENDRIVVTSFQGLGNSKVFYFSEIEGYSTIVLPSEYEDFEYLYIIKNGRKVIKISDFYHANYQDLKNEISKRCKNLGAQKFSILKEFKDIFSK